MRVLIVGAGVVGANLARQLSLEGNDVAVVDRDLALIEKITEKLDVYALHGDGARPSALREAGVERSDMVVAVTDSDAVNMLVCASASRYGVTQKIARVRDQEFVDDDEGFYKETFHVDQLINPEAYIAASLSAMVRIPSCVEVAEFDRGDVLLCGFAVAEDVPLAACTIQESRRAHADRNFLVVAVSRDGALFLPRGDDRLAPGDKAYVILPQTELEDFLPLIAAGEVRSGRRIVLVSGSPESQRLALSLEDHGHEVAVIEQDATRARVASERLRAGVVYRGEATDLDALAEAGAGDADFFVAAGPEDESNLLSALLAKRQGARRTVVFTREAEHLPVLNSIGLDVVINPRLATVGAILHRIRRGRILKAAKLANSDAEALQFEVPAGAPVVGTPLKDLDIPREALVGAVHRGDDVRIADGATVLEAGDRVVVFTLPAAVGRVERLFEGG